MVCFIVYINGKKMCKAGINHEYGVLTAILSWIKRNHSIDCKNDFKEEELCVTVGGHTSFGKNDYESIKWLAESLKPGDEITIKIAESDAIDKPLYTEKINPEDIEKQKLEYFKKLKKEYEGG